MAEREYPDIYELADRVKKERRENPMADRGLSMKKESDAADRSKNGDTQGQYRREDSTSLARW